MAYIYSISAVVVTMLVAGCATYESYPTHTTTSVTGYSYGAAPYYSPPVYYVEPAPIYVAPNPVYVRPAPAVGVHIQSGPRFERRDYPNRKRSGRNPHADDGHAGNARDARIGGPGWPGTVWSR